VASWTHHFEPQATGFDAVAYEEDKPGAAVTATKGDLLVLRFSAQGPATATTLYVPNSDGANAHGRIPSLTLPK
jgi:hypothetical protein